MINTNGFIRFFICITPLSSVRANVRFIPEHGLILLYHITAEVQYDGMNGFYIFLMI